VSGNRQPVTREHTGDPARERAALELAQLIGFIGKLPFLHGKLIDGVLSQGTCKGDGTGPGVSVGTAPTIVEHGLGRAPKGFIVLDASGAAGTIWRPASQPTSTDRTFNLQALLATTVKLWVW
jgi:hypothetical protein